MGLYLYLVIISFGLLNMLLGSLFGLINMVWVEVIYVGMVWVFFVVIWMLLVGGLFGLGGNNMCI